MATAAAIEALGGTAVALPLDIGKTETFPAFRDSVAAVLRGTWQRDTFDFLVNNAGTGHGATLFEDTPDDVGAVIAMLASDGGRWITGQSIEVTGGYNL
jgi:NAD(P)-dependent dehydrogenase (short-subunit alcohol dehydrogenase family)